MFERSINLADNFVLFFREMLSCTRAAIRRGGCLITQCRHYGLTAEHESLKDNLMKLIDKEINPHCDKWEKDQIFPAHEVFKLLGEKLNLQQIFAS